MATAPEQGLYRVAKVLPVDWRTLKQKMTVSEPVFVETRVPEQAVAKGHALEVETARGRLRVTGLGVSELAELLASAGSMIQLTPQMRVLVAVEPVDFRKGIDGLAALCKTKLAEDPFSGVHVPVAAGGVDQGAGV